MVINLIIKLSNLRNHLALLVKITLNCQVTKNIHDTVIMAS